MFRIVLGLLQVLAATLTRVGRLAMTEGGDTAKPIGQVGGFLEYREFLQSIDLASVATVVVANQAITVTGLAVGDIPVMVGPTEAFVANLGICQSLGPVGVANTLNIRVVNPTAGAIDAAAVNFVVGVLRPL